MKSTQIIEALRSKLAIPTGRHLYGILGTYSALSDFTEAMRQARMPDGERFPKPLSVNKSILRAIPDDEFLQLVQNEAKRPEPTSAHVGMAFETVLRSRLETRNVLVLEHLELVFAYNLELNLLRTLAADQHRVILLLPGRRERGQVVLFPDADSSRHTFPSNLIANNHLWELSE